MGKHLTHNMLTLEEETRIALLQGTLDLLILRILVFGRQHGQGIARAIQLNSDEVFLFDHWARYPALQRLEAKKWISAEWDTSSKGPILRAHHQGPQAPAVAGKDQMRLRSVADTPNQLLPVSCCRNEAVMVQQTHSLGEASLAGFQVIMYGRF